MLEVNMRYVMLNSIQQNCMRFSIFPNIIDIVTNFHQLQPKSLLY